MGARPRAFGASRNFARGKILMPGGFTPPEQIKTEGFPGGREPAGARTHWEGMKNTMALCLLYLDVK